MNFVTPLPLQTRIQGMTDDDVDIAKAALTDGSEVILQFSRPATDAQLAAVEALAAIAPDRVTLRFYGFYGDTPFDASVLAGLRNVRRFNLDCMWNAVNLDVLGQISGITHLALEVWDMADKDILHHIDPSALRSLRVGDMKTKAIDGSALARFTMLESVWLSNSAKAHDGMRGLPHLRDVTMRARPKDSYAFLADCPALTRLEFFLGGAPDMHAVRSDTLTGLSVIRCRGLNDMGDLGRFPRLTQLVVDDQIQLKTIDLTGAPGLEQLRLINCKTLAQVTGIEQTALQALWVYGTALDLDALEAMDRAWTTLGLFSGRKRDDDPREARLAARGLGLSHGQTAP